MDRSKRILTWTLASLFLVLLSSVGYLAANPHLTTTPHTEFYLLGQGGSAAGYPTELAPGESDEVTVGLSNYEHRTVTYRIDVHWNDTTTNEQTITLEDRETREVPLSITAPAEPGRYQVQFRLYQGNETTGDPDLETHLLIRVREQ
jgi:uncharacterized membrane protein